MKKIILYCLLVVTVLLCGCSHIERRPDELITYQILQLEQENKSLKKRLADISQGIDKIIEITRPKNKEER